MWVYIDRELMLWSKLSSCSVLQSWWPCELLKHTCTESTFTFLHKGSPWVQGLWPTRVLAGLSGQRRRALSLQFIKLQKPLSFLQNLLKMRGMIDFSIAPYVVLWQFKNMDKGSNFLSLIYSMKEALDVEILALFLSKIIKVCKEEPFYH